MVDSSEKHNTDSFLVAIDTEKAFDSLSHSFLLVFLLAVLKKFGFGTTFIDCIEAILNKSDSYVINSGKTTQYFQLNRGAFQRDPISAYLFYFSNRSLICSNKE